MRHVVTYPEYWAFRLTGVAATEVTSLGCHTDLWDPHARRQSSLARTLGIDEAMAPTRKAGEVLGRILPKIAQRTGLPPDTPVHCGIHDSNASLLPHLLSREAPFGVVSTGTWIIAMAIGAGAVSLDAGRDTLINVDALGDPVPSARFMGGREHDLLMQGAQTVPTEADIGASLGAGRMLLPAVVPETGPFRGRAAGWIGGDPEPGSGVRAACVGFYLGLMTAQCLALIGLAGPIQGAALLARGSATPGAGEYRVVAPQTRMADHVRLWQDRVG